MGDRHRAPAQHWEPVGDLSIQAAARLRRIIRREAPSILK